MFKKIRNKAFVFLSYALLIPGIGSLFLLPNNYKTFSITNQSLRLLAVELLVLLVIGFIYRKEIIKDLKSFKINFKNNIKKSGKYYLIGVGLMILFNFLINIVFFKGSLAANETANRDLLATYPLYALPVMILIAPITEELIFRVNFKSLFKNDKVFIIFSALFFAAIHIVASFADVENISANLYQLLYILPYGALGYAFAKIYTITNNMFYSIAFHILQNAISIALILISI